MDDRRLNLRQAAFMNWVFTSVGVAIVAMSARSIVEYVRSQSWVPVTARIEEVHLALRPTDPEATQRGNTWRLVCRYAYTYNGRDYVGTRVVAGFSGNDNWDTDTFNAIRDAAEITVYVNPQQPGEAALFRVLNPFGWLGVAFGVIFILLGQITRVFCRWRPDWCQVV